MEKGAPEVQRGLVLAIPRTTALATGGKKGGERPKENGGKAWVFSPQLGKKRSGCVSREGWGGWDAGEGEGYCSELLPPSQLR